MSLTPSSLSASDGLDKKGEVSHGLPVPQFAFNADSMSSASAVFSAHSHEKNVTAEDLEMLLRKALDGASEDYLENGSGSGSGDELVIISYMKSNFGVIFAFQLDHWINHLGQF